MRESPSSSQRQARVCIKKIKVKPKLSNQSNLLPREILNFEKSLLRQESDAVLELKAEIFLDLENSVDVENSEAF